MTLAVANPALDTSDDDSDGSIEAISDALHVLENSRYLNRTREAEDVRPKDFTTKCTELLARADVDFGRNFRMFKAEFYELLSLIEHNVVFISRGPRPQAPVAFQLMVALYRFGHDGNAAGNFQVHEKFGIGEGTSCKWTERVIVALLRIEPNVTRWPTAEERHSIAAQFDRQGIPGGCVGAIDGFHVVLHGKPRRDDAYAFFNRKDRYSFNVLGVADHSKRIRYISCGYPGSAHDMRVYRESLLVTHPQGHFDAHQYLLADSAYTPSNHCVPLFKRLNGQSGFINSEGAFNLAAAEARVVVEHTYGILKCRWSSLQGLRIIIASKHDEHRATGWIRACVVLHNLLIDSSRANDAYGPSEGRPEAARENEVTPTGRRSVVSSRHHPRRVQVMRQMGLGLPGGPATVTR